MAFMTKRLVCVGLILGNSSTLSQIPAQIMHLANFGLILTHRLQRWYNIKPTLAEYLVFARRKLCLLCPLHAYG